MKIVFRIVKWIGVSIGVFVALLLLSGLTMRLITPRPQPPGELIEMGGFKLHLNSTGVRNEKPTLVIEAGAGAPGAYYHWLSEGLKDRIRVVRYDRAGIGYSELAPTPRSPETIAKELHQLLEQAGESPPYIMAGHSYGGHYIRIFTQLYPEEVVAMVFLDASHPESGERLGLPPEPWFIHSLYQIGAVLGDLGVLQLYDQLFGPILWAPGLPEKAIDRLHDYATSGKYLRGYLKGDHQWGDALEARAAKAADFGALPIRVFSGTNQNDQALKRIGVDPVHFRAERKQMQQELAELSTRGELFFMEGGHITIFTLKEQADFICDQILELIETL